MLAKSGIIQDLIELLRGNYSFLVTHVNHLLEGSIMQPHSLVYLPLKN